MSIKMIGESKIKKINFPDNSVFLKIGYTNLQQEKREIKYLFEDYFVVIKNLKKIFSEAQELNNLFENHREEIIVWLSQPKFNNSLATVKKILELPEQEKQIGNLTWLKSEPELVYIALFNLTFYEYNGFLRIPKTSIEITTKLVRNIIGIEK